MVYYMQVNDCIDISTIVWLHLNINETLVEKLDGNYTRILCTVLKKSRKQNPTKQLMYRHLPLISKTIQAKRTNHAGHNLRRCPWCNGYRPRKWTRRHEFKSWPRLIAFHIALIPLGKVWIQLFSLQLWVNSRAD